MIEASPSTQAESGTSAPGKRERTRLRLLENAIALFREQGVRETKLAEVARASDVAPATLFNHFPNRSALAAGWVRGEIAGETRVAAAAIVAGERGLRASVRGLCRALARASAEEPTIRLAVWREAGRTRVDVDAHLTDALRTEQAREHVRADQPPERLADVLLDAIEGGLVEGLGDLVALTPDDPQSRDGERLLADRMQARVDLVLDGARKRNERVRPGASRSAGWRQRPASV